MGYTRQVIGTLLLDRSLDPEARARLLREARAAAGLNHPHIIIFDVGEGPGGPFIVMELASGKNLRHLGPQPIPRIAELARQLGEALDHAHRRGTIHRDLPGWPPGGAPIDTVTTFRGDPLLASDGAGGAIVVWCGNRTGGYGPDIPAPAASWRLDDRAVVALDGGRMARCGNRPRNGLSRWEQKW